MTGLRAFGLILTTLGVSFAQTSSQQPTVVCIAGQCLQGYSNITLGAKLSANNAPTALQLLPGQYTSSTNPQLLHSMLTSSSATLQPSPGFDNATNGQASLPLSLNLSPGLAIYSDKLYSGQAAFTQLPTSPTNSSSAISAKSLYLGSNVWVALSSSSQSSQRTVVWESIPDISQIPALSSSLSLLDIQSTLCSPSCSPNGGVCSASGSCSCKPNFTGPSCETCASGFFGVSCSACPSDCSKCDDGINGSGRCLSRTQSNEEPDKCNCLNGKCGSDGQCQCNAGWTQGDDGKQCSKCADGFFQTSTGDCKVCNLNCLTCSSTTGQCLTCKQGFTLSPNDQTRCNALPQSTSSGSLCPDGSFAPQGSSTCQVCDSACKTCTGPGSGDCGECAQGSFMVRAGGGQGTCVKADNQGLCQGTGGLVADNLKKECDTCGAKCVACQYPSSFNAASTVDQVQCTACLPGSFLSQGKCVDTCPDGTFIGQDGVTCTKCDSSCSSCSGSSTFCTACSGGQLAGTDGKCVSTCPDGTFASSGSNSSSSSTTPRICQACHPDCATCSGPGFSQCTKCSSSAPILSGTSSGSSSSTGRCLAACPSKNQYFDNASSSCKTCDGSCSSCSGPGKNECLACSDPGQVLKGGSCVAASCASNAQPIPGMGVCFSDLVNIPTPSGTTPSPLPTITGLTEPTKDTGAKLEWWQILLMALGCAFIFVTIVWCWRRRALKKRKERTQKWWGVKVAQQAHGNISWKQRLLAVFSRKPKQQGEVLPMHQDVGTKERYRDFDPYSDHERREKSIRSMRTTPTRKSDAEAELLEFIDAYDRRTTRYTDDSRSIIAPSVLPSLRSGKKSGKSRILKERLARENAARNQSRLSVGHSLYSEYTGQVRQMPEPRQPINRSLFRQHTISSMNTSSDANRLSNSFSTRTGEPFLLKTATGASTPQQTEAERYAASIRPALVNGAAGSSTGVREGALIDVGLGLGEVRRHPTGASGVTTVSSRNPFRIV